jgi:hypothetical protein
MVWAWRTDVRRALFHRKNKRGKFEVRAKGSKRATALLDTEKEAIQKAKQLNPDDKPDVERVRNTKPAAAISGAPGGSGPPAAGRISCISLGSIENADATRSAERTRGKDRKAAETSVGQNDGGA